jgi:hypothetical protein
MGAMVIVEVAQQPNSVRLIPHNKSFALVQSIQYQATAYDQFGHTLRIQPASQYFIASGPGSIGSTSGIFTSSIPGAVLIEVHEGVFSATVGAQVFA